jgi:Mg2+ and Co2+ transporter CorA
MLESESHDPASEMIAEIAGPTKFTFVTDAQGESISQDPKSRLQRRRDRISSLSDPGAELNVSAESSTRAQLLRYLSQWGLLKPGAISLEGNEGITRIKLSSLRMVAEDWNTVLSQMNQTLDDIDEKMADNTELRENILAWRRLLCSWRVTVLEYTSRLSETKQCLLKQADGFGDDDATISNPSRQQIKNDLDSLLDLYDILSDAIKSIQKRIDRSFHALMSSMSIIESERAIVQGGAIGRLTELAFFFIPLNFASTFFSMQITVSIRQNLSPRMRS